MSRLVVLVYCFFFVAVADVLTNEINDANYERDVENVLDFMFAPCEDPKLDTSIRDEINQKKEAVEKEIKESSDVMMKETDRIKDELFKKDIDEFKKSVRDKTNFSDAEIEELLKKCEDKITIFKNFVINMRGPCIDDSIKDLLSEYTTQKTKLDSYIEQTDECKKVTDCLNNLKENMVDDEELLIKKAEEATANFQKDTVTFCSGIPTTQYEDYTEVLDDAERCMKTQ